MKDSDVTFAVQLSFYPPQEIISTSWIKKGMDWHGERILYSILFFDPLNEYIIKKKHLS